MIKAILTDIEGTTSSIEFVKEVLFPYARKHLPDFVQRNAKEAEVRQLLEAVGEVCGQPLSDEQAIEQMIRWMDEDRKVTPLKSLQGLIWEAGYRQGDYFGHVYPDVPNKLQQWHEQGLALFVYSSGSVYAQKLLFGHTQWGDLNPLFSGNFDTHVGKKQEVEAYREISRSIAMSPAEILFLSDTPGELDAASQAGMKTCQLLRKGAVPTQAHPHAVDFNEIDFSM